MSKLKIMFIYNDFCKEEILHPFLARINPRWEIKSYKDGISALESITNDFDVIISEYDLPVVTGITILNYTKIFYPQIKRILVANYFEINEFDNEIYHEYNIIDVHIRKPFVIGQLLKAIEIVSMEKYAHNEKICYGEEIAPLINNELLY